MKTKKVLRLSLLTFLALVVFIMMQFIAPRQEAMAPSLQNGEIEAPAEPAAISIKPVTKEAAPPSISFSDTSVAPGDYFAIIVTGMAVFDEILATSKFSASPLKFFPYGEGLAALIPVSYTVVPGEYPVTIEILRAGWHLYYTEKVMLEVVPKDFEKQYLTVTAAQNAIRTSDRQYNDWAELARGRSVTSPVPLWEEDFIIPVEGRISTEFGLIRYVNNANPTRHSGLDIAAPAGTPIKATNNGRVTLAQSLYVPGNTVLIDHGLNVFSNHYHLDEIFVQEGDTVKKGDIIGTVGSTGFSTGPHLHWTITIGTMSVNPWQLTAENPLTLLQPGAAED